MNTDSIFVLLINFTPAALRGILECTYAPCDYKNVATDILKNLYKEVI